MDIEFFIKCLLAACGVWVMFYVMHISAKDTADYDNDKWPKDFFI